MAEIEGCPNLKGVGVVQMTTKLDSRRDRDPLAAGNGTKKIECQ